MSGERTDGEQETPAELTERTANAAGEILHVPVEVLTEEELAEMQAVVAARGERRAADKHSVN